MKAETAQALLDTVIARQQPDPLDRVDEVHRKLSRFLEREHSGYHHSTREELITALRLAEGHLGEILTVHFTQKG